MSKPDFTEWLGDPESEDVRLCNLGELIDWAGRGLGGDSINRLLDETEQACREYSVDTTADMDILCMVGRSPEKNPPPWEILVGASLHSAIPDADLIIGFEPIVKDTRP